MKKYLGGSILSLTLFLSVTGCSQSVNGRIDFSLEGGSFNDPSFATTYLEGKAGTPVTIDIPTPVKDGYYFVGWREKTSTGSYRTINKRQYEDGNFYYYYPYGTDTFYAYFEPLVTLTFDLTEGAEEGKLIDPKFDSENFVNGKLNGYASKTIASTDYLPTADATNMHLNFEYWYTKYPLVSEKDENQTEHYHLDSTQQEGVYRFDQSFSSNMAFPIDTDITLYAYWEKDPTITVVFNLDGYEDYSFQAKDSAYEDLTALMKREFKIDYSIPAEHYYFIDGEINKRFAGFFLDSNFKQKFFLDSTIASKDFTLYLKWENKIDVTLDYNGGTLNGETSHTLTNYYEGDVLGQEIYNQYSPENTQGSFSGYQFEGEAFSFANDELPGYDLTLVADYNLYPTLTLSIDYPDNYSEDKISDEIYYIKPGEDITNLIDSYKLLVTDSDLVFNCSYMLNQSLKVSISSSMSNQDTTIYLQYDYSAVASVSTYANTGDSYVLQEDIPLFTASFGNGSNTLNQLYIASFNQIQNSITIDNKTYLFDGIYSDEALTSETLFPLYQASSHQEKVTVNLYRKMTQAITLTFYSYSTHTFLNKSLQVLPNGNLSDYQNSLTSILGSYQNLYVKQGEEYVKLNQKLPESDTEIYVEA